MRSRERAGRWSLVAGRAGGFSGLRDGFQHSSHPTMPLASPRRPPDHQASRMNATLAMETRDPARTRSIPGRRRRPLRAARSCPIVPDRCMMDTRRQLACRDESLQLLGLACRDTSPDRHAPYLDRPGSSISSPRPPSPASTRRDRRDRGARLQGSPCHRGRLIWTRSRGHHARR